MKPPQKPTTPHRGAEELDALAKAEAHRWTDAEAADWEKITRLDFNRGVTATARRLSMKMLTVSSSISEVYLADRVAALNVAVSAVVIRGGAERLRSMARILDAAAEVIDQRIGGRDDVELVKAEAEAIVKGK